MFSAEYDIQKQGKIFEKRIAELPADVDVGRVHFQQGDACDLQASLGINCFQYNFSQFKQKKEKN